MKRYTFTITVDEGNDEFWEAFQKAGKTGCDEVLQEVCDAVGTSFPGEVFTVVLSRFEDDSNSRIV